MNRADAQRLVDRLREVREDRGATANEAAVAARKAASLVDRFQLNQPPPRHRQAPAGPPPRRRARPRPVPVDEVLRMSDLVFARAFVPDWEFDPRTGKGSDNVRVVRYQDHANWRIEVDP